MNEDIQTSLLETIDILVEKAINSTPYTTSHIGKVVEVSGFECIVELYGQETKCKLLEHLHTVVREGDIVIVQDLYNNNVSKFVQSKLRSADA